MRVLEKFVFLQRFFGGLCAADIIEHEALCSSCEWEREKFRIKMQESVIGSRILRGLVYYILHFKVILTTSIRRMVYQCHASFV